MQSTVDYRCFHPHITGEEAERQLKACGTHGSFLCRRSEDDPYTYTLSVLSFGEVIHFRMKYAAPYFSLYNEGRFDSPLDVIQHYVDGHGTLKSIRGGATFLKSPLINANIIKARWYHGGIHPEVVESLLNERGQDGSFLVRASYKSPGDYSLSVRVKDEIVHVKIFSKGKKFDLGTGDQFDKVEDLIVYYKKCPFSVSKGTVVKLQQGIDPDPDYVSAGLSHSKTFHGYLTPSISQASDDNRWQPVHDVSWTYVATYTIASYISGGGKGAGLIEIIGVNDSYSLDLNGNPKSSDYKSTYFRLYKTFYIPEQCQVICFESVYHPGHYIQWNTVSLKHGITFYKGTPNVPDTNNRYIGWNEMESPTENNPTAKSYRAWTTPVPPDPQGFFFYFGPPDDQSTDSEDYTPGLTPSFKCACAVIKTCKLDCPITDK